MAGLLSVCLNEQSWRGRDSGDVGIALDLWVADELRRAGYERDAVWPRSEDPRVFPADLAKAVSRLSASHREDASVAKIIDYAGSAGASVQGEFFAKSVDVLVADWDRGIELMVSTKAMVSSFGKNLTNRWEEFVGDLRNIRGRHPLAALGVVFLADSRIVRGEPNAYRRLVDMLRKLRLEVSPGRAYDATTLILARPTEEGAELVMEEVPPDLLPGQFFEDLLARVLERLPVSERQGIRALVEGGRRNE